MGQKYAIVNGGGVLTGGFTDTDVIPGVPAGGVAITDAQWLLWVSNPAGYTWNGVTVGPAAPAFVPPSGYATRAGGCTVHSTGTPAINATYAADVATLSDLTGQLVYVTAHAAFPGGLAALTIADITGANHVFGTTVLFTNFVNALIGFVAICQQYDLGVAGVALPAGPTVIA